MARKTTKTVKASPPASKRGAAKQPVPKPAPKQPAVEATAQKTKAKSPVASLIAGKPAGPASSAGTGQGGAQAAVTQKSKPAQALPQSTASKIVAATMQVPVAESGRQTSAVTPPRIDNKPAFSTPKPVTAAAVPARPARTDDRAMSTEILAKAETDINTAIELLNHQMNTAIATLTELAVSQRGYAEAVVRTMPLDRATAMFQRLVSEVVDEQLAEMLPPLVGLRNELAQRARQDGPRDSVADDFHFRGLEMLDQVLTRAGVMHYDPRPGAAFDPVIHLAVGETHRGDLGDGTVSEVFQPGYRTARGKVISPAKVKVNRR